MRQRLDEMSAEQREQLVQRLMEKLEEGGYINMDDPHPTRPMRLEAKVAPRTKCSSK